MIHPKRYNSFDEAIEAFKKENGAKIKEASRRRFYSPDANRKHHNGKTHKTKSSSNGRNQKQRQRRY